MIFGMFGAGAAIPRPVSHSLPGRHTAPRFTLAAGPFGRHSAAPFHACHGSFWGAIPRPISRSLRGTWVHTAPRFTLAAGPFGRHSAVPFHASVWELFRARFALAAGSLGAMPRPVSGSPRVLSGDIPLPRFTLAAGFCGRHFTSRFTFAAGSVGAIPRPVSRSPLVLFGRHSAAPFHACRGAVWAPFRVPFHARCGNLGCHTALRFTWSLWHQTRIARHQMTILCGPCGTE